MAERVQEMPKVTRQGRTSKFPWDQWLDGSIWRLVENEDWDPADYSNRKDGVPAKGFISVAIAAANSRGSGLSTVHTEEDGKAVVYLQAREKRTRQANSETAGTAETDTSRRGRKG